MEPNRHPKIIFADTNDPGFLERLGKFLESKIAEPKEILVNAITESGETAETVANLEFIANALEKRFKNAEERFIITTSLHSKPAFSKTPVA